MIPEEMRAKARQEFAIRNRELVWTIAAEICERLDTIIKRLPLSEGEIRELRASQPKGPEPA